MRILYLSQYFPPEAGATQARSYEMAKTWVDLGHQVTMLTEFPNHPSGIIPPSYRGKVYERDILDGIDVLRVWIKASPEKSFSNRMLFYLTYMVNASLAGLLFSHGKYDFVYATSPPLFVGGAALTLSYLRRTPLVFEVRDLWPASAVALGELTNSTAISLATHLEEACYHRAVQTVVVTEGIYAHLIQRGIQASRLYLIPNGTNLDLFSFDSIGRERIRRELGLEEKFIAIYAGILGVAQGLETVIETARLLISNPNIHILLIGDGPKKTELHSLADSYRLPNLTLLPEKPREQIPAYLSAADVAIVPLKKAEVFKGVLPSKLFDAWACERPVVLSIDGEARALVEAVHGGIYIPPEEPYKMAEAIITMLANPSERQVMGKNGLSFTQKNHSRAVLAKKLITHLEQYIEQ